MQDLTLVGVHDDGEHLVLTGPDGQRFRVQVDEQLRAAVRRDRARLGQLQIEQDGRLRPRDIQARIRAGQTADEIAEEANLPVEHVRRYEGPVLAEREFVVRQARAVRIRRPAGSRGESGSGPGGSPTLGDLVAERLAAREVHEAESTWDAWRADDGAWLVALTFTAGSKERRATWTYDAQLRHVSAQDDEARWLTEDVVPQPVAAPRRLVPIRSHDPLRAEGGTVHDRIYDVEADGGVRAADEDDDAGGRPSQHPAAQHPAAQHPSAPHPAAPHPAAPHPAAMSAHPAGHGAGAFGPSATVDLLDNLRERRGRRNRAAMDDAVPEPFESAPAAIWTIDADLRDEEPPAAHPPFSRPELAVDSELLELPDGGPRPGPGRRGQAARPSSSAFAAGPDDLLFDTPPPVSRVDLSSEDAATTVPAATPAASVGSPASPSAQPAQVGTATPATGTTPARRNKRASVPSWDDIVFGSRRE